MKRAVAVLFCLFFAALCPALAEQTYSTELGNGIHLQVSVCNADVLRVRISPRGDFPRTLPERYGIVTADLGYSGAGLDDSDGRWIVSTGKYSLVLDRETSRFVVNDKDGRVIVGPCAFNPAGSAQSLALASAIDDNFRNLGEPLRVIGDESELGAIDKSQSGDPASASVLSLTLKDDECFYGGGTSSHRCMEHRGEILRIWAQYQCCEIPIPFLMSSEGWGVFDNCTGKIYFDVAATGSDVLNIYNPCDEADVFLVLGGSMPAVLDNYTQITGRPYVLPKWAYGFCFGPNKEEDQWNILRDAMLLREKDYPCDLIWLEPQWMERRYDYSVNKKVNQKMFEFEPYWLVDRPGPKKLYHNMFVGRMKEMGFNLGLWLCEDYDLSLVEEDKIASLTGTAQSGQEHWMDHLMKFVDLGVKGFKLDPSKTIYEHPFREYYNGSTDALMHNLNQVLLCKQMAQTYRAHTGKRSWHHYCSGWSGSQHWGAANSGDNGGGQWAVYDQLNLSMSGYMNISCDVISGMGGKEMEGLHFGTFIPWMQLNSWATLLHPFYFPEAQQKIFRNYLKLRYSLIPYIYSSALEGAETGMPIVRAMPLEFPDDRAVDRLQSQYMFGPFLCVGTFVDKSIYLPEGVWTDAWTGQKVVSRGQTYTGEIPSDRAGYLFIRQGAIIPCLDDVKYIGCEPVSDYIVKFYPHGQSSYVMRDSDAESYGYEQGRISYTKFECEESGKKVKLTVNPVQGTFENMPPTRNYTLQVALDKKPSRVMLNGKTVRNWVWTDCGKMSLTLKDVSVSEKIEVICKL